MVYNCIKKLTTIPANDCNFISALQKYATNEEIEEAIQIMQNRVGNKSRIAACERELRKRKKQEAK